MAIVLVLVLLVAVGGGVVFAISGKKKKDTAAPNSVVSPTRPNYSGTPLPKSQPETKAQPAPGPFPLTTSGDAAPRSAVMPAAGLPRLGLEGSTPKPLNGSAPAVGPALAPGSKAALAPAPETDRFAKVVGPVAAVVPQAKPVVAATPPITEPAVVAPEPEVAEPAVAEVVDVEEVEADVAPELVVAESAEVAEVEADVVPEPVVAEEVAVVEADVAPEPEPTVADVEAEVVIDLADEPVAEVVLDLDDLPQPLDEVETQEVDHVLKALIGRVRITHEDVDAVATELVDRADLDAEGVAEVLADLAEIAEATAEAERLDELTLFSSDVPSRPGQLTRFAELDDVERRRVIIRVLCLLVARADDSSIDVTDDKAEVRVRAAWPVDPDDADDLDLPTRLVKS